MNAAPLRWAGRFTRGWVRAYTTGLPRQTGQDRRDEIASDLWEHAAEAGAAGAGARATAAQIFGRAVLGMPADVSWHLGELKGDTMATTPQRLTVVTFALLGLLSVLMGVAMLVGLALGNWAISSDSALFSGLLFAGTIAGVIGPFVALAGVYALRRAQANGTPLTVPRGLLIVGTGGIALFGGVIWWTVVGPIIAIAILSYWAVKIGVWRRNRPASWSARPPIVRRSLRPRRPRFAPGRPIGGFMTRRTETGFHGLMMLSYRWGAAIIDVRLARVYLTRFHAFLLRRTRGRLPGHRSHLVLSTTGRKTGKTRRVPLIYVNDDRRYAIIASRGGSDHAPVWWLNLQAHPDAAIEIDGRTIHIHAAEASAEDRERIWPALVSLYPPCDDYAQRTKRHIPVLLLTPSAP